MASRPHILFLCHCLPYPPEAGATSRTFNILKELQKEFDISLVAFSRSNHQRGIQERENSCRALEQLVSQVYAAVPVASEHSMLRRIWDHVRSLATSRPYTFYEYWRREFQTQLRTAISRRKPDLIHIDSLDLHRWVRDLPQVPITCTHHDIDSELLRRRAAKEKSFVVRSYIDYQARLIEQVEREFCPKFNGNLVMSTVDAMKLETVAPGTHTIIVPNGVDTHYFSPTTDPSPVPGRVIFVGPTVTFANRDAVEYLLRNIWPRIHARDRSAGMHLIGRCSDSDQIRYSSNPGVSSLGQVSDIRPHLAQACCCVVPIRIGGGTRMKILDAWAMGKPVVSTSIGCEGLDAVEEENILIRDTPEGFAEAVLALLSDPELRAELGRGGRKMVEEKYSWTVIGHGLRAYYWSCLRSAAGPDLGQLASRSAGLQCDAGST